MKQLKKGDRSWEIGVGNLQHAKSSERDGEAEKGQKKRFAVFKITTPVESYVYSQSVTDSTMTPAGSHILTKQSTMKPCHLSTMPPFYLATIQPLSTL